MSSMRGPKDSFEKRRHIESSRIGRDANGYPKSVLASDSALFLFEQSSHNENEKEIENNHETRKKVPRMTCV